MDVEQIEDGLWRWTAIHPEWKPGEGWEPEVGCVYVETPGAIVLIDPLVPEGEDGERFWRALERDVERTGLPVVTLLTTHWHERSAAAIEERHGLRGDPPAGIEAIRVSEIDVVYWIPTRATLVAGDALVGTPEGLRLQPPEWLEGDYPAFVAAVAELCRLPIERILPSHGTPVLTGGREALAHAHQIAAADA